MAYRDKMRIIIDCTEDAADRIIPLLERLKQLGDSGSSRGIIIQGDEKRFSFDGDGASNIFNIKKFYIQPKVQSPIRIDKKILATEGLVDNGEGRIYWGKQAAGTVIIAKDTNRYLFLLRSKYVQEPNTWSITTSGAINNASPRTTVIREVKEELNYKGKLSVTKNPFDVYKDGSFRFYTFKALVASEFKPELNWEHSDYKWVDLKSTIPTPLHFGTKRLIPLLKE